MKSSRPSSIFLLAGWAGLLLVLLSGGAPAAQAQAIQVESADPPVAAQGTVNLNVLIKGNGFERGAVSRFFVTGTTAPGGVTVNTTTFFTSTELIVNIDVANAAVIADFDIEVENLDRRTGKGIELLAVLPPGSEPAPPGYVGFMQQDYATGSEPVGVVTADFNGDGMLDLATVNNDDNSLSVLLGNGDGTFGDKTDFAIGLGPCCAIAAADFNGDTHLDLAATNFSDDSVSILLGSGDGTFQRQTDLVGFMRPRGVVAADFNSDGRLDLAVANHAQFGNTVSVLLGNGDGTFGLKKDFATSTGPLSIVAADFNGDGRLDVATINLTAETASVLLGNGDGTFGARTDFPTASGPRSLTAVDFNRDGKLDLATGAISTASVLLGRGNGTFDPRTDLSTDRQPVAVIAADFDDDGKPDLAIAHNSYRKICRFWFCITDPNKLSLRFGNSDGTFGDPLSFWLGARGPREASAAAGDFNADGRVDLAITDPAFSLVTVLLQAPALSLDRTSLLFSNFQAVGTSTPPIDLTISSTGSFSATFGTASISGTDAGDFSIIADSCSGATVAAGSSCVVSVMFTPSSLGAKSASLTIPNNAVGNPHVVNLRGSGVPNAPVANLTQTNVGVGDVLVGNSLTTLATSLQNIGGATLNVGSITMTGAHASDFRLSPPPPGLGGQASCNLDGAFTLAPGASCALFLTFTPSATDSRTADIIINSDAPGSPHMVALSGNGVNLSLGPAPGSPTSKTIQAGQSASFILQLQAGSLTPTLMLSCSHSIPAATCAVNPNSVSLPGSATVTITTTARGSLPLSGQRRFPPVGQPAIYPWVMAWLALAALAGFSVRWWRPMRLRLSAAAVATLLLSAALSSGCGGSSAPLRGTPPGTYSITVRASDRGATSSATLSLTVR